MGSRTLYTFFRSSAAYRARIALNLKGLSYERISVSLPGGAQFAADYQALNPQQQVPTLVEEDGTVLIQSPAILEYLEEVYPDPPLLPEGAVARARVRAIAMAMGCDIHPLNNLRVLKYLRGPLAQDEDGVNAWIQNWTELGLGAVETMLALSEETGDFCHGDAPTFADVYLAPQIYHAQRFNCPLDAYPTIGRVHANALKLRPFLDAFPDTQPDAT
ncbi:MAG TPA: maleylacetoacetate isomerase [Alphaproteobacteria bacterium]|nr:maleylacetoacetate isomerase [Alphaproteobacteria bacterium]